MQFSNLPPSEESWPFSKQAFWLSYSEYSKIYSEINQLYYTIYIGKTICAHTSFGIDGKAYVYWFENHGFNNYNIYLRVIDNH